MLRRAIELRNRKLSIVNEASDDQSSPDTSVLNLSKDSLEKKLVALQTINSADKINEPEA